METRTISKEDWLAEGTKLFGEDRMNWKFVCPVCKFVQTAKDYEKAGASVENVAFSCVGRWAGEKREAFGGKGEGPCNYAGGGLFRLNPVHVIEGDHTHQVFEFYREEANRTALDSGIDDAIKHLNP